MSKKILGLLLVLCLVVGLLPVVALADDVSASVKFGYNTYTISAYDSPVYTKNASSDGVDTAGNTFTIWRQVATDANENNYNAKFVWHTGDATPTLYLRGLMFDLYNEEKSTWLRKSESSATKAAEDTGISVQSGSPLTIVITGEDSTIKTKFGITYADNLTISSEGDSQLVIRSMSTGIYSGTTKGKPLTFKNANVDVSISSFYGGSQSQVVQTLDADLTIEGGNLKVSNTITTNSGVAAIVARGDSGNIYINGNVDAYGIVGAGGTNGTIKSTSGKVVINGGTVNSVAKKAVGIYGELGVEINGGTVNVTTPYFGISTDTKDDSAKIAVNGGVVEVTAKNAFNKAPVLGTGVDGVAGVSADDADYYDDTKYGKAYVKLSTGTQTPAGTTPAGTTPNTPAQTTPNTPAQTTPAGTQGNNNPTTGDSSVVMFSALLLVAVFGIVATVAFGKKNCIAE